jgi:hypothetical protein
MTIFGSMFFVFFAWWLWTLLGVIANALGFYKTEDGKTHWSLTVAMGVTLTFLVFWQLYSWAAAKWGGAYVAGFIIGIFVLLILPLNILMMAARKK